MKRSGLRLSRIFFHMLAAAAAGLWALAAGGAAARAADGAPLELSCADPAVVMTPVNAEIALKSERDGAAAKRFLEVRGRFPGSFGLSHRLAVRGVPATRAEVEVRLPESAPADMQAALFLKDKDGLWFQCAPETAPRRGEWETLVFNLSPAAGKVQAQGHAAVWNAYYARHVAEIGISFFSPQAARETVNVARLRLAPPATGTAVQVYGAEWLTAEPFTAYHQLELSFGVDGIDGLNPFDPDQIAVDAVLRGPDGKEFRRPAFYYQGYRRTLEADGTERLTPEGRASWRVRFTPTEPGTWQWRLAVARAGAKPLETPEHAIHVDAGPARGFVQVSKKDGRFFETADGAFFYPVGEHIHTPFDRRSEEALNLPMPPSQGTFTYDYYFRKMQAGGANLTVVWMSSWWLAVEWTQSWSGFFGLNDYNLANAWRLDYLFEQAEAKGIHLLVVVDNHGKFSTIIDNEWRGNPISRMQGGPCRTPEDAYTSDEAMKQYRKRMRYLVARWGENPYLMGWEVMSELDLVGNSWGTRWNPDRKTWFAQCCAAIRDLDRLQRPLTVQYSGDWKVIEKDIATLPVIDFLVADGYKDQKHQIGSIIPMFFGTYRDLGAYQKPSFIIEYGGSWNGAPDEQMFADFHTGLWTSVMHTSGAAPCFWWYYFIDHHNLYPQLTAVTRFQEGEDLRGVVWTVLTDQPQAGGKTDARLEAQVMRGPDRGRAWIYSRETPLSLDAARRNGPYREVTLTIPELQPGTYGVEYWDTFAGTVVKREDVAAPAGQLRLAPPEFAVDCAVKFRRQK